MSRTVNFMFLNMNESGEKEVDLSGLPSSLHTTTTVLERMVILEEMVFNSIVNDEWDNTDFIIIGGARLSSDEASTVDLADIEERIKEFLIADICGEGSEGVGSETPFREELRKRGYFYEGSHAQRILTANALRAKIQTETEIRRKLNLPYDSSTTERNMDIIAEAIKRDGSINSINLISTPEHMYRIRALWEKRLSIDSELRYIVSSKELSMNYKSLTDILDSEYRRTLRFAKDRSMELIANNIMRFGLYGIAERFVSRTRKDINKGESDTERLK